jgi:hypothetical protein
LSRLNNLTKPAKGLISSASAGLLDKPIGIVLTIEGAVTPDTSENFDLQLFLIDTVDLKIFQKILATLDYRPAGNLPIAL